MASRVVTVPAFDENAPQYRCCCGCMHVRTGAIIIGIIEAFGLSAMMIKYSKAAAQFDADERIAANYLPVGFTLIFFILGVVGLIYLLTGICTGNPKYFTPMLLFLMFTIVYQAAQAVFVIIVWATGSKSLTEFLCVQMEIDKVIKPDDFLTTPAVQIRCDTTLIQVTMGSLILGFIVSILVTYWWYRVIKDCKIYYEDKKAWERDRSGAFLMSQSGGKR